MGNKNKQTQSELDRHTYRCSDCDFVADCVHDFTDHTHSPDAFDESEIEEINFKCNFCTDTFITKTAVMNLNKTVHTCKVDHCINYLENMCTYGENCWFLHDEAFRESESAFKCNLCKESCKTKSILMKHKKSKHFQSVSNCLNENRRTFGSEKCWYIQMKMFNKHTKMQDLNLKWMKQSVI